MAHVDKKARIIDRRAQITATHNLDLMAIISSFLEWGEIAKYVRVCKAWNKSFLSRNWSTPKHLVIWRGLPISSNYIKYVNGISIRSITPEIVGLIRQTSVKKLFINDSENIELLLSCPEMKIEQLCIYAYYDGDERNISLIGNLIQYHRNLLHTLDLSISGYELLEEGFSIGQLPSLKHLAIQSEMMYDGNHTQDLWDICIDLRFLSYYCPKLEKLEINYKYNTDDTVELIEMYIERLYKTLIEQNIKELKISEDDELKGSLVSLLITQLPILLQSKTLKYIELELFCPKLGGECMFIKRIDPKLCKIKIAGLQDQYDVIEN